MQIDTLDLFNRAKTGNKTARSMLSAISKADPEAKKYMDLLDALAAAESQKAPSKHSLEKEAQLQEAIVKYLRALGWMVNESLKGSKGNSTVYYTKGTPDLWIIREGKWAWIELKRPGQNPDADQQKWHEACRKQGGVVLVIRSMYELEMQLREAGLM